MRVAGETIFNEGEKVSAEVVGMLYSSFVDSLSESYGSDTSQINRRLKELGRSMGERMTDEFFARLPRNYLQCNSVKDSIRAMSAIGFKAFLGVEADAEELNSPVAEGQTIAEGQSGQSETSYALVFQDNPLACFTSALLKYDFHFSNLVAGVVEGSLAAIGIVCVTEWLSDPLYKGKANEAVHDKYAGRYALKLTVSKSQLLSDD